MYTFGLEIVVEVELGVLVLVTTGAPAHCAAASLCDTIVGVFVSEKTRLTLREDRNDAEIIEDAEMENGIDHLPLHTVFPLFR